MDIRDRSKIRFDIIYSGILAIIFLGGFAEKAVSQNHSSTSKKKIYGRLDVNKPTIYINFIGRDKEKTVDTKNDLDNKLKLALCNNTSWEIFYYVALEDNQAKHPTTIYDVEDKEGHIIYRFPVRHVLIQKSIPPGKKIFFSIKEKNFIIGSRLFVEFNYKWESRNGVSPYATEPNHKVFFSYSDLSTSFHERK